jgi:hypothetical protein
MNTNRHILTVAMCATAIAGRLQAQQTVAGVPGGVDKNVGFQYFFNNAEPGMAGVRMEPMALKPVTGKPFSATETRRTRQTLGDGTHIDKVEKDKFYRDYDGRTRIERENGASVSISDPSTGAMRESANGKSRVLMMRSGSFTALPDKAALQDHLTSTAGELQVHKELVEKAKAEAMATTSVASANGPMIARTLIAPAIPAEKGNTEDLGDQVINGVMAHGTRSTITIPEGQIGNDREIKVISERWFSNDLGVLIKSTNNDPRFGETTFELTDILQGAQDPTLFEMPPVKR